MKRPQPSAEDYQSAREYLNRVVPVTGPAIPDEWEAAVAKCAAVTARLRRAAERHKAILEKLGDE